VNATPAVGNAAAVAAHNEGKIVCIAILTISSVKTTPVVYVSSRSGLCWNSITTVSIAGGKLVRKVVLVPLWARALLPLSAAEVAEFVVA
jgi:hypothetical protein